MTEPGSEVVGVKLVHGRVDAVADWVRRGVVACRLEERPGWTLVSPADGRSAAAAPYDDAATLLLARPVGPRLAPALGLLVKDGTVAVTAQAPGWRSVTRWLVRSRHHEVTRVPQLPVLRPGDLAAIATRPVDPAELAGLWQRDSSVPRDWAAALLHVLGMPGAERFAEGSGSEGTVVQPDAAAVKKFEAVVRDGRA